MAHYLVMTPQGDAGSGVSSEVGHVVIGVRVDDERGPIRMEEGVHTGHKRDKGREPDRRGGPIRPNLQIPKVSAMGPVWTLQAVLLPVRVE